MSKNPDRYKESHLEALDEDTLLELDTERFEKFAPKKKNTGKQSQKSPKNKSDE